MCNNLLHSLLCLIHEEVGLESEKEISKGHTLRVGQVEDLTAGFLASSKGLGYAWHTSSENLKKV